MTGLFDNLPKLSSDDKQKQTAYRNTDSKVETFVVKKCPLMEQDTFKNMEPSMWNKLIGTPVQRESKQSSQINAHLYTVSGDAPCMGDKLCMLTDSNNDNKPNLYMNGGLPKIYGISNTSTNGVEGNGASDDEEEKESVSLLPKLTTSATLYAGALSLVGLFVLYRVVKKTI